MPIRASVPSETMSAGVHGEQGWQLRLVSLELLPRRPDSGVLVGGVLQFDDAHGQSVYEQHDVRPAGVPVLGYGELVDGQPVVVGGDIEVDDLHLRPTNASFTRPDAPPSCPQ